MKIIEEKKYNYSFFKIRLARNNIFITITDLKGNVLLRRSGGMLKFKHHERKNTHVAEEMIKRLFKDFEKSNLVIKMVIIEIQTYLKSYEIISILKKIQELNNVNDDDDKQELQKKKKEIMKKMITKEKKIPFFYLLRKKLISHNGMRGKKPRRM